MTSGITVTKTVESILRDLTHQWQTIPPWVNELLAAHKRELEMARLEGQMEMFNVMNEEMLDQGGWELVSKEQFLEYGESLERQIAERKANGEGSQK